MPNFWSRWGGEILDALRFPPIPPTNEKPDMDATLLISSIGVTGGCFILSRMGVYSVCLWLESREVTVVPTTYNPPNTKKYMFR